MDENGGPTSDSLLRGQAQAALKVLPQIAQLLRRLLCFCGPCALASLAMES